jgi:hypothetical protein
LRTVPSASTTLKAGVVAWFMASLIFGKPQSRTKTERIANGIQALNTTLAGYFFGVM